MVEELSHLLLFVVHFLGDPLMVGALLISFLLFVGILSIAAFWRLSRRVVQVLKGQKEIKALITEALVGSHETPHPEEHPASVASEPEAPSNSISLSSGAEFEEQEESAPRTIVQTYRAGKSLYLLYSDGSVEADTDGHIQTFASIHLLKEAMARKNQNTHLRSAS